LLARALPDPAAAGLFELLPVAPPGVDEAEVVIARIPVACNVRFDVVAPALPVSAAVVSMSTTVTARVAPAVLATMPLAVAVMVRLSTA